MHSSSLRARLLLWYTAILGLVISTFAVTIGFLFWRSLIADVDRGLRASAATLVDALRPLPSGGFDLNRPTRYRYAHAGEVPLPIYYGVWNADGDMVDRFPVDIQIVAPSENGLRTRDGLRELTIAGPSGARIVVGRDVTGMRIETLRFASAAATAGAVALAIALVGGWFLVGRALAPVSRISRAATALAKGDLSARVAIDRTENELEQLAVALNSAFDQVHAAMQRQQRFTADASHELRTPLATIAAETEWALSRTRTEVDFRESLQTCQRSATRMRRVVERLLAASRGEAPEATDMTRSPVAIESVVTDALTLLQPLADKRGLTIHANLTQTVVTGDREALTEVIANLFANAVEYNRDAGSISVETWPEGSEACLLVRDTGVGIPADHLPYVFDRFYRADKARTGQSGGVGLGLSIAKRIVEAHGGCITCQSTVGRGTDVLVRLPRAV